MDPHKFGSGPIEQNAGKQDIVQSFMVPRYWGTGVVIISTEHLYIIHRRSVFYQRFFFPNLFNIFILPRNQTIEVHPGTFRLGGQQLPSKK
jgi:hypothetical protein